MTQGDPSGQGGLLRPSGLGSHGSDLGFSLDVAVGGGDGARVSLVCGRGSVVPLVSSPRGC